MSVPESVPDTLMLFGGAGADLEDGYVVSASWFCSRNTRWASVDLVSVLFDFDQLARLDVAHGR
jgi:hypothetical protein